MSRATSGDLQHFHRHRDAVLDHAQTVVIGNKDPDFKTVPESLPENQLLMNFVRIKDQRRIDGKYDGICC